MSERKVSDVSLLRRLFLQAKPFWPNVGVILLLGLLSTPLALLTPIPLKIAVDSFTGHHSLPGFMRPFVPTKAVDSASGMLVLAAVMVVFLALTNQLVDLAASLLRTY